jgi:hypothetical protein
MPSLRALTTLFCHNLLFNTSTTEYNHLTLHHPSRSISASYRAGYDGCYATMSFTVAPDRCLGYAVQELDDEVWDGPHYAAWTTFEGYAAQCPVEPPSEVAWTQLLALFNSVELITDRTVRHSTGANLAAHPHLAQLLAVFD